VRTQSDVCWEVSLDAARERANKEGKALLLDFRTASTAPAGAAIDIVTYPDPRVASFIRQHFVAVRMALRAEPEATTCFEASRGPVIVVGGGGGEVHYRVDGTLPPEEFVAQLGLGLGRHWLDRQEFAEAIGHFREVADRHKGTRAAAQALFWLCVVQFEQATGRPLLQPRCEEFRSKSATNA